MPFRRKSAQGVRICVLCAVAGVVFLAVLGARAQSNSGLVQGTVTDPSNAVVPGAIVKIENPVSGYSNQTTTDTNGAFRLPNIPFNPYHLTVTAQGFSTLVKDVDVRSTVPINEDLMLKLGSASTNITVTESAADLIEEDTNFHTDVDRGLFDKLPLESQSSSVSSLVTLASPGVVADSNGLFHGLGDHAENSFSVDGQPITDQQSKVFSNQIPADSIQSMEVISGAPPAEFGDKTSLVIKVTTRSGLGQTEPHGSVTGSFGSFHTGNLGFDLAWGGPKWGNFISANGLNTNRFLDPPEFTVLHATGNEQNIFDRLDFKLNNTDTIQVNGQYTRSWFQTPNSFDNLNAGVTDLSGNLVGPQDQRAQIKTFNIAPLWTHLISQSAVYELGGFVRQDQFSYFPSADPFADLGQTVSQNRKLTNAGARTDVSYVKGIHNLKAGATYQQTLLTENFSLGITDPGFIPSLLDANGNPCVAADGSLLGPPCTVLAPFDLTTGGSPFLFQGRKDVKELSLYVQDTITWHNWNFNLGIRGDFYNGYVVDRLPEPRVGVAYNIKPSNTVLRFSYARVMETPFNENLILASTANPIIADLLGFPAQASPLSPGHRNEYHAGLEQAFGKKLVIDADYMWKYTHNAFDFSALTPTTPIFFPIEWDHSKITGFSIRANVPNVHGFTAFVVLSGVSARFYNPQTGGLGTSLTTGDNSVFRIDHDQKFQQTTHVQYQPWKRGPWLGFNWRYDSGEVAGEVPCAGGNCANGPAGTDSLVDVSELTPDEQFQAGLFCGSIHATPTMPIHSALGTNLCPASSYGSTLLSIPAPGTEDDDHNPPRVAPRHLFDLAIGDDNLFGGDRYKMSLRFTIINLANKEALYNFLSTFSGTHYVTPRTETVELGFHF